MSQAFYRKWRPQTWDEVVAQEHVVQTLRNAVRTGRTGHAYLLAGPRGTGKTTTARLLAKALNCLDEDPAKRPCDQCEHCRAVDEGRFLDLIEIDAASNTSVDDIRDLREKINFSPTQGRFKVYIIDEVHMLSTAAFNALLKTLEEPPPHAVFILATTEVHKIPATILSRCQRYEFRRIPVAEITRHLKKMAAEEHLSVDEDALQLIARQATGAMRDAISLLDQLSSTGNHVGLAEAQQVLGTATSGMILDLVNAILARDAAAGLKIIQQALDAGTDPRQFARQAVDYLRSVLLILMGSAEQVDAVPEVRTQMAEHAHAFSSARLIETIRLFNSAATDTRSSWHPGLAIEMAFAESIEDRQPPVVSTQAVSAAAPARTPTAPQSTVNSAAPQRSAVSERPAPTAEQTAASERAASARPTSERPVSERPVSERAVSERAVSERSAPITDRAPTAAEKPAAQTPAAQAPADPPVPGKAGFSQHDLDQNWARVRQFVKRRNPLTEALLNSIRSRVLKEDGSLILGFQGEVVKSKMEMPENIELVRQAIQAVLGSAPGVRCILVGNKSGGTNDPDVDSDGMVRTALDLGGKIVYEE